MYPRAYIEYLVHFHGDRDYFECHEILEDYWKRTDRKNKQSIWVGFIQLAVSCYHHRRGNFIGAQKTLETAIKIFTNEKNSLIKLGLNGPLFIFLITNRLLMIKNKQAYKSFHFPIVDEALIRQCKLDCELLGFKWCSMSDLNNAALVHRHKLRDRSRVLMLRQNALNKRKGNK